MNYRKAIWLLCLVLTIQSVLYGQNNQWSWMKGDITPNFAGVYGTKGAPDINNKPGSRDGAVSWADLNGNIWLFGGSGYSTSTALSGDLNDLWKFDTISKRWTWVTGNSTLNSFGVYGNKGTAAPGNQPGSRSNGNSWTDQNGNLWLFGGYGNGKSSSGWLNDLWKFDTLIKQWTWVNGDSIPDVTGVYGTQGIGANGNKPGGRYVSMSCTDNAGNFWLFGGIGFGSTSLGALNDLWKYNAVSNVWTWIKGDNAVYIAGVYGTKGIPNSNNKPGSRERANAWTDQNGNFWLFGGYGNNSGSTSYLNDLWKFDTTTKMWTWITGENSLDNGGVYGTQGVSSFQNTPGSRSGASNWKDGLGNFWLFGGEGHDGVFSSGFLNDLWKYNISTNQWTWIKGDINSNNVGVYGTQGSSAPGNKPGSRASSVGSTNVNGDFWLFGQFGYGSTLSTGSLNDLWKFKPCSAVISLTSSTGNFCSSASVLLTASGGTIYEWYKDGVLISGAAGNSYSAILPGSYHAKSNIGSCLDVYSNEVILEPGSIPPSLGGTGVYCLGDNVSVGIPGNTINSNLFLGEEWY